MNPEAARSANAPTKSAPHTERAAPGAAISLENTVTLLDPGKPNAAKTDPTWARLISSPQAVLVLVPLLVLVLGVTLTVVGQLALTATSKTMAKERFVEQTATCAVRVESALAQADPVLVELENLARQDHESAIGLAAPATQMRNLLLASKAISQVYIAFEDGSFWGYGPGRNGQPEFQRATKQSWTSYTVQSGTLIEKTTRAVVDDPRGYAWYQKAKQTAQPVWSNPYVFEFNHRPGLTRARPFYVGGGHEHLLGVVAVDFDVQVLTAFMAAGESGKESARSVVFSPEGAVLAYPFGATKLSQLSKTNDIITHTALADPELSALIKSIIALPRPKRSIELHRFKANTVKLLASVRRIGAGGPEWYVASFADESSILRELHTHRARSLWIGGISLALAVAIGWRLARYIFRVKTEATQAQAAAERAQEQVRDLGSYRLLSLLGEGGMGEVWRARHRLLAREAAIKLIKLGTEQSARREEQRERFRREAQAIARLRSHHTVALFDYGVTPEGTLFYVMELLDGIDLSRLVLNHGSQTPDRVRQIMIQVCSSLSEAHDSQLIHRDIKPANLFLCREADDVDVVKVLDFGLVFHAAALGDSSQPAEGPLTSLSVDVGAPTLRQPTLKALPFTDEVAASSVTADQLARITNPDHQLGTPAFMSPEQAIGGAIDYRTDLYSLGCVAWWLLTGRSPYKAESQLGHMMQHIEGSLNQIKNEVPVLSDEFAELLMSCLSKDAGKRPSSARRLSNRLQEINAGGPAWTPAAAQLWWAEHLPRRAERRAGDSVAPLRDVAVVLPPTN